jgi:lactate racemase
VSVIELPWAAWHADSTHRLECPSEWIVDRLTPKEAPQLADEAIQAALEAPINSDGLDAISSDCRTACIAVDDLARPTRASDILPFVFQKLHAAGLGADSIRVVIATGSHGSLSERELRWKLGDECVSTYRIECHNCRDNLAGTGVRYGDSELQINRAFLDADLKVAIGTVLPHPFAGFSGGAKLVLPGLADLRSIQRSHQFVQMGLRGGADPNENRFRLEAERIARDLGLKFSISVVTNVRRETVGVFAGDPVDSHRQACAAAKEAFGCEIRRSYDCALVNAFPKDIDLLQSEAAFVVWKTAKSPVVREGGVVVLTTAASAGLGRHGLFEPGGVSYVQPQPKRWLKDRELWIYSPGVSGETVHQLYWNAYPVFQDGSELMKALERRLPDQALVAVFPCGPMQCLSDLRA